MSKVNKKAIYMGLGVMLGLAIAYIVYSYIKTQELNEVVGNQKKEIESLKQESDSLLLKLRTADKRIETERDENNNEDLKSVTEIKEKVDSSIEEVQWENALNKNSFEAITDFIMSEENKGTYQNDAISKLKELGQSGWLFAGRTNDNSTYSKDQVARVIWRNYGNDLKGNSTPKTGDIITLNGTQGRRTYSNSSPRDKQNGIWQTNNNAYVSEINKEGQTALIIKIIYK
jgi:hypothetical protein